MTVVTKTFCSVIKKGDIFAPLFQRLTDLTEEVNSLSCLTSLYVSGVQVEFQKWLEKSFFFLCMNILSFYWLHKIFSAAVSLSIQDEFSMRYWHILKWLNDSHVRQWDHHVDDRSIKSNFSVPFRVAKQSRRSHVKKDHKVNSFGRKRNCESSSLTFENFLLFRMIEPIVTNVTWREAAWR